MAHRIDLKMVGFESVKKGSKAELEQLEKKYEDKGQQTQLVKYNEVSRPFSWKDKKRSASQLAQYNTDEWELYVKK